MSEPVYLWAVPAGHVTAYRPAGQGGTLGVGLILYMQYFNGFEWHTTASQFYDRVMPAGQDSVAFGNLAVAVPNARPGYWRMLYGVAWASNGVGVGNRILVPTGLGQQYCLQSPAVCHMYGGYVDMF